jgi:hypothetical protein
MFSAAIHFGVNSAHYEQRPLRWVDVFKHSDGYAIWVGPVGFVLFRT